jgi:cytochrome P450
LLYTARVLLDDAELCGKRVPKGTTVWVPFYPMFVDPALWEEPFQFRPDRFKDFNTSDPKYSPFSAGPRNCTGRVDCIDSHQLTSFPFCQGIGQAMAVQEMEIAIAAIVKGYDFKLAEHCRVEEVLEITLKPKYVIFDFLSCSDSNAHHFVQHQHRGMMMYFAARA